MKNQGKKLLSTATAFLIAVSGLAAMSGCSSDSPSVSVSNSQSRTSTIPQISDTSETPQPNEYSQVNSTPTESQPNEYLQASDTPVEPQPSEDSGEKNNTSDDKIHVGDTVTTKDFKIILKKAFTAESLTYNVSGYDFEEKPDDGKVYLITEYEIENISFESFYISSANIEASVDGYSMNSTIIISKPDGLELFLGNVMPGKKLEGYIAYEIDKDWQECELAYVELFSSTPSFAYTLTSDKISKQ